MKEIVNIECWFVGTFLWGFWSIRLRRWTNDHLTTKDETSWKLWWPVPTASIGSKYRKALFFTSQSSHFLYHYFLQGNGARKSTRGFYLFTKAQGQCLVMEQVVQYSTIFITNVIQWIPHLYSGCVSFTLSRKYSKSKFMQSLEYSNDRLSSGSLYFCRDKVYGTWLCLVINYYRYDEYVLIFSRIITYNDDNTTHTHYRVNEKQSIKYKYRGKSRHDASNKIYYIHLRPNVGI